MYGCRVIQKVTLAFTHITRWHVSHKRLWMSFLGGWFIVDWNPKWWMVADYVGNRSCRCGSKDQNGGRAGWECHALCSWSKWESCHSEVHRVCSCGAYSVYCHNILWPSCDTIHSSIWVSCNTGLREYCFIWFYLYFSWHVTMLVSKLIYNVRCVSICQRVLEHCRDEKTQSKVMEEIMASVSMLAQDQYGNYVVQVCNFLWKIYGYCSLKILNVFFILQLIFMLLV